MDDPLCRSRVWLRNAFSIQGGRRTGTRGEQAQRRDDGGKESERHEREARDESEGYGGNVSVVFF